MVNIDNLVNEWAYRCEKGYPDMDSPSDLRLLKVILKEEGITMPLKEDSIEDIKDKIEKQTGEDVCDFTDDQIRAALDKAILGKDPKTRAYIIKNLQNTCAYNPVLSTLRTKGYGQSLDKKGNSVENKIVKKYANEIKQLTIDATEEERDIYINYLSNPSDQINFKPKLTGNLYDDAKSTGIPPSITNKIMQYVTTDSGNKGVGMGEFGMALLFKNIGDAVGAGDLSINGETFEIKGENATLGKRPDEINAIDVTNLSKYMIKNNDEVDDKDLLFRKEDRKTKAGKDKKVNVLYYKGTEVKKNTFAEILSDIYNLSDDKNGFKKDFKEALRVLDTSKKEKHSEAIDEYFDEIDWTTPKGIQNGIALLNFYRYVLKEKFQHFLAHDFGTKGNNKGNYVYASGSPKEMVDTLMGVATFQPISPDNLKPRIGFKGINEEDY